jgi:uncharacterized SAM-binding protein YcdF (DUF218 family)
MKIRNKIKKVLFVFAILFTSYVVFLAFDIYLYGFEDEKTNEDVAIILGAGISGEEPSPVFQERINHGIWLYQNGYVKKILFTGGKGKNNEKSDSFVAREYAIISGISFEDILIEEKSVITQENIFYASQIMKSNNMETAILVSDPIHMKRVKAMAKYYGIISYSSPTPTTKYKTLKTKIPFLVREIFFFIGYKMFGGFYRRNLL